MSKYGPRHLHSLDVARGIAAIAVVLWHWQHFYYVGGTLSHDYRTNRLPLYSMLHLFYDYGDRAVPLFFSLSGFVFFWLYAETVSSGSLTLRAFAVQRVSRLYPLHVITFLSVALMQPWYRDLIGEDFVFIYNDAYHFALNCVMLAGVAQGTQLSYNGPSWSVSVEIVLYGIFFLYCVAFRPRLLGQLIAAAAGFVILGHFRSTLGNSVGSFFLGGAAHTMSLYLSQKAWRRNAENVFVVAVAMLWLALLAWPPGAYAVLPLRSLSLSAETVSTFLFPTTILALVLAETRWPAQFERAARITRLGPISYSIYLIHFPLQLAVMICVVRGWIGSAIVSSFVALPAFFALAIPLSLVSHYYFELPMQRRLRRLLGSPAAQFRG